MQGGLRGHQGPQPTKIMATQRHATDMNPTRAGEARAQPKGRVAEQHATDTNPAQATKGQRAWFEGVSFNYRHLCWGPGF